VRRRMRILLISDYFPPYVVGGAEISAYNLAIGLSKLGHDVSVLTRVPEKTEFSGDFTVYTVRFKKKESILHYRLHTGILSSLSMSRGLADLLRKEDFDVIHAHNWISACSVMHVRRRMKIPPSILSIRDYRYFCPSLYGWCLVQSPKIKCNLIKTVMCAYRYSSASVLTKVAGIIPYALLRDSSRKMLEESLEAFDAYITNSNFVRKVVLNNLNLDNVYTVYNSVDTEKFNIGSGGDENGIKILYAGRFDTGKGVEYLIGAIPEVIREHDCIFVFVGGGALRKWAENLARKAGGSRVVFEGFVPYERINRYYQLCDIVVVPSVWPEPFGRSVIEAMACGKPVVATRVGGIPEIVEDGRTGLLIEPANSKEIANAINTLVDRVKRKKMGKLARKVVERKYNIEVITGKVLEVYEKFLR